MRSLACTQLSVCLYAGKQTMCRIGLLGEGKLQPEPSLLFFFIKSGYILAIRQPYINGDQKMQFRKIHMHNSKQLDWLNIFFSFFGGTGNLLRASYLLGRPSTA
jgi:hypothetical protein